MRGPGGWIPFLQRTTGPAARIADVLVQKCLEPLERRVLLTGESSVSGAVFDDPNANGVRDAGEAGMAGWRVFIDRDDNGYFNPQHEVFDRTDADGNWTIGGLKAGLRYRLRVTAVGGWSGTTDAERLVPAGSSGITWGQRRTSGSGSTTLAAPSDYWGVRAVDSVTGRGIPLVEFTNNATGIRYYTDSGGWLAIGDDAGEPIGQSVNWAVQSYGYNSTTATYTTTPNGRVTLSLTRNNVAQRLYRITGQNIYKDTVNLGFTAPLANPTNNNGNVDGSDSSDAVVYKGKLYWIWEDTGYDFGNNGSIDGHNLRSTLATSDLPAGPGLQTDPEAGKVNLQYLTVTDASGNQRPKPMFPTSHFPNNPDGGNFYWSTGFMVVRDNTGAEKLLTAWSRHDPNPGQEGLLGRGLAYYDDALQHFRPFSTPITFGLEAPHPSSMPVRVTVGGQEYFYFTFSGRPSVRVKADWNSVTNPAAYETYTPLKAGTYFIEGAFGSTDLVAADVDRDGAGNIIYAWKPNTQPLNSVNEHDMINRGLITLAETPFRFTNVASPFQRIHPHNGSVFWNDYRKAWVLIASTSWGGAENGDSFFGETWYSEAPTPEGPWVNARKVSSHFRPGDSYSFYNPHQNPMLDQNGGKDIFYEGTYTIYLSDNADPEDPTPDYDYNQMMYKLDLSDSRLHQLYNGSGADAQYWDNADFTGNKFSVVENAEKDWAAGAPDPGWGQTFSARWTGLVEPLTTGNYTFSAVTEGGVRLWVNGQRVLDSWADPGGTTPVTRTQVTPISLEAGRKYDIRLEYTETTGDASVKLRWAYPGQSATIIPAARLYKSPNGLIGTYYDETNFTNQKFQRTDPQVNHDWKTNSPDPARMAIGDTFSTRWTGMIQPLHSGDSSSINYWFRTDADDGVRLWVNGVQLINDWNNGASVNTSTTPISLQNGKFYDIRMEFYDNTGDAKAKLLWGTSAAGPFTPIPTDRLFTGLAPA